MQIYLMRHAEAVDPGAWRGPDRTRPLTDAGVARLKAALSRMRTHRLSAEALLTSPYERASQTARLIAEELHVLQTVQCPDLAAGARLDALKRVLIRHLDSSPLWIVAHMPEISVFASRLTGDAAALERSFSPGEMLAVDCSVGNAGPSEGRLLWRRRLEDWMAA